MPTYTFKCPSKECKEFEVHREVIQSMKADKPICEACGVSCEVVHNSVPLVHYKGNWFSNMGKY